MQPPPPIPASADQSNPDEEHVRILAICYFVLSGLAFLGIGFLVLHYAIMSTVMTVAESDIDDEEVKVAVSFFGMFRWFYVLMGFFMVAVSVGNFLCGRFLLAKKSRVFCMVVAGVNCLQVPFGVILGVFTFIILGRDSVRKMFDEQSKFL